MPKHLPKGYLECKGVRVCLCVLNAKKVTRYFVGESRFVSYFSVAVSSTWAFTPKKRAAPTR